VVGRKSLMEEVGEKIEALGPLKENTELSDVYRKSIGRCISCRGQYELIDVEEGASCRVWKERRSRRHPLLPCGAVASQGTGVCPNICAHSVCILNVYKML
jgi:hypothetical protein